MIKPLFSPFAWGALALGSALPLILWQELSGNPVPVWLLLAQALALLALLVAAHRLPALRPFENLLRWLLCLAVGWHLILGGVFATSAWQEWQQDVPWVVRGAVARR